MSKFEDHLWTEFVREHGDAMARLSRSTVGHAHRRPRLVAGTGLGVAGVGAAVALVLGATSTAPAFAVTRNRDGTVTISIQRHNGIAGANARLRQLGIRANVAQQPPAGCRSTVSIPMGGKGAPESATETARAHWRIDPSKVLAGHQLVLTPVPAGNSGNSGTSGNGASEGQVWNCAPRHLNGHRAIGVPAPGGGEPAPGGPPPAGNSGHS